MMCKPVSERALNQLTNHYKTAARKTGRVFSLDKEQMTQLLYDKCFYCGIEPCGIATLHRKVNPQTVRYNGIDRVDNSLGYVEGNVVTCCTTCNLAKRAMTADEFRTWVKRAYEHLYKGEVLKGDRKCVT